MTTPGTTAIDRRDRSDDTDGPDRPAAGRDGSRLIPDGPKGMLFRNLDLREIGRRLTR